MIEVQVNNAAQAVEVDASALTVPVQVEVGDGLSVTFTYLHIRYANVRPTKDEDIKTTPGAFIGTAVSRSNVAPTSYTSYVWYDWRGVPGGKGEKGDPGKEPRINYDTLHWEVFDAANGVWVDTGVSTSTLLDENSGNKVLEWFGTIDEYNALETIRADVRYNILEGKVIV